MLRILRAAVQPRFIEPLPARSWSRRELGRLSLFAALLGAACRGPTRKAAVVAYLHPPEIKGLGDLLFDTHDIEEGASAPYNVAYRSRVDAILQEHAAYLGQREQEVRRIVELCAHPVGSPAPRLGLEVGPEELEETRPEAARDFWTIRTLLRERGVPDVEHVARQLFLLNTDLSFCLMVPGFAKIPDDVEIRPLEDPELRARYFQLKDRIETLRGRLLFESRASGIPLETFMDFETFRSKFVRSGDLPAPEETVRWLKRFGPAQGRAHELVQASTDLISNTRDRSQHITSQILDAPGDLVAVLGEAHAEDVSRQLRDNGKVRSSYLSPLAR
jgi:hypothetical protein